MHFPQSAFLRLLAPERKPLHLAADPEHQAARPAALARDYGRGDDNMPGGRDTVGHSSVQAWSAGDFFPAVIAIVESYTDTGEFRHASVELSLDGVSRRYATYDDAAAVARHLINHAPARASWRDDSEG